MTLADSAAWGPRQEAAKGESLVIAKVGRPLVKVVALDALPPIHKDRFDRMLVAQAMVEGITLLTTDPLVARYPGPVRGV